MYLYYILFSVIFTWASIPMDFIDSLMSNFGNYIHRIMPEGMLRDLVVDGIIAGIGGIVIFLPQIILLMFLWFFLRIRLYDESNFYDG